MIQLIVEGNAALITCLLKKSDIPVKDYATLWSSQPPLSNHLLGPRGWQKSNKKLKIEYILTILGMRAQWNVLPRGRVDLHQIYHVHYCSEINKVINNNKLNVL